MGLPRYERYKDSGVEWIGEIPTHWEVRRLKHLAKIRLSNVDKHSKTKEVPVVLCNYTDVYYNNLITNQLEFMSATATKDQIESFSLKKDDVLITKDSESPDDIAVPAYVPEDIDGIVCGYHLARIVTEKIYGKYLFYALQSKPILIQFNIAASGITRFGIGKSDIGNAGILVPGIEEQRRITDFLDERIAEIDQAISQKKRLIDLLKEQKAILINQAVTKGLNPKVAMRDSGVEWIGEIPSNWKIKRIKFACKLETGHTPQKTNPRYWIDEECTIPWVSLNDTKALEKSDFIDDTAIKISERGIANSSAHIIPAGAVVFNRDGARVGLAAITKKPMAVSQHIIAWVCKPEIYNLFLLYVIYALKPDLDRITAGATIPTIGMGDVKEMVMPVPPIQEQEKIMIHILKVQKEIDGAIEKVERQILKTQELRQILISNAVTGKIRVP